MTDFSRAVNAGSPVSQTVTGTKMKCIDMKMTLNPTHHSEAIDDCKEVKVKSPSLIWMKNMLHWHVLCWCWISACRSLQYNTICSMFELFDMSWFDCRDQPINTVCYHMVRISQSVLWVSVSVSPACKLAGGHIWVSFKGSRCKWMREKDVNHVGGSPSVIYSWHK